VDEVLDMEPQRIVVSGGEPLLHQQQDGWTEMLEGFAWASVPVEVETNGTIAPNDRTRLLVDSFNVSPKLAHAGDPHDQRLRFGPLRTFAGLADRGAAVMKVVAQQASDVVQARDLAQQVEWPLSRVWVMPEGTTAQLLLARHREIADAALANGLNFTTRLHVLTWGEERAR
jgi:organic radical activating enzyme